MAETIIDRLNRFLGGNPSVRKVADDLQLTSELILLVRMMFADGKLEESELAALRTMCERAFGLEARDMPQILEYLRDYGYETTAFDAAAMFRDLEPERKQALLVNMLEIARADLHVDASEEALIRRTAEVLGLTADDISRMRSAAKR